MNQNHKTDNYTAAVSTFMALWPGSGRVLTAKLSRLKATRQSPINYSHEKLAKQKHTITYSYVASDTNFTAKDS